MVPVGGLAGEGDRPGAVQPAGAVVIRLGDRAEEVEGPSGLLGGDLFGELVPAPGQCLVEGAEVLGPGRVDSGRRPGVRVRGRQAEGFLDPGRRGGREGDGTGVVAERDDLAEHGGGVVAGGLQGA